MLRCAPVDGFRIADDREGRRPRVVLLPPQEWGHRLGYFFSDVTLKTLPGVGHFTPLEAPPAFAAAVRDALVTRDATN